MSHHGNHADTPRARPLPRSVRPIGSSPLHSNALSSSLSGGGGSSSSGSSSVTPSMATSNPDQPNAVQRTASIDSTLSSLSSVTRASQSARSQPTPLYNAADVPVLIAQAGSADAAILKLLQEKQSASNHTAQLWRLVEKQRAMILGLNRDLERTLKEKDKYRKRLKEHMDGSASAQPAQGSRSHDSHSSSPPLPTSTSLDSLPLGHSSRVPVSSTSLPSLPAYAPPSASGSAPSPSARDPPSAESPKTPQGFTDGPHMTSPQSFSSPKERPILTSRKTPPAPLNLALREASDSEDIGSEETPPVIRGRKKTREDDDRQREALVVESGTASSASPMGEDANGDAAVLSDTETLEPGSPHIAQVQTYQSMGAIASALSDVVVQQPKRLPVALNILSPGLPMSPRPGDRPLNSPMPRAPKQFMSSIPTSPRLGGTPLSPRAPRQPIPMPPQTPLSFASPHLARAETYHALASNANSDHLSVPSQLPPETERSSSSTNATSRSPGEVYRGLVSEQYPGLLLPPNALPSIYIKVDSSRLRPSRNSYMAPKISEETPVITIAVFARSDKAQLWRVEKTLGAMSVFDQQIKAASSFKTKLPDRALFTGHAPARIDARRNALGVYFDSMLDTPMDDQAAVIICGFLTADAIATEMTDYFPGPQEPMRTVVTPPVYQTGGVRKDGYLTKRGKNFGGWKARYFVLDGPIFKYFEAPGGAQLGSIKLSNAQIGKQGPHASPSSDEDADNQYRHAFLILEPKRKDSSSHVRHVLCAESDEERDAWVEALLHFVDIEPPPSSLHRPQDVFSASRSPRMQKSMSDIAQPSARTPEIPSSALRSVPYQATIAAEAPVIGPRREQATPSPVGSPVLGESEGQQSSSHPLISGPTNGTVIQNAESWGNRKETLTQTKDKKRSIFGFRGRSSSDTVPGALPKDLLHNDPPAPSRPVFGVPLAEVAEFSPPSDVPVHLPAVVYRCIEYLRAKDAPLEEGIFRLSGSNIVIKALRERFNTEGDVKLLEDQYYDIHAVASLLKLYLRELPASILTREHHLEFLKGLDLDESAKVEAFNVLVNKLPIANRELLEILSSFLREIVDNEKINKMGVRNVGIVFAPTLNIPAPLISLFVMENTRVFGPPVDISSSPASSQAADTPVSDSVRSPRKQALADLSTPGHNQTAFYDSDTESSPQQQQQQQPRWETRNENGNSTNDKTGPVQEVRNLQNRGRNVYSTSLQSSSPMSPMSKQARRESNTLFMNIGPIGQRDPVLSRLRENESIE